MQSSDIQDYLIPRENPGDATFIGNQQESLSAEQESQLRQVVRQVRANCKAGEVKDLEKLFDTSDPQAKKFQEALLKDVEQNPDLYRKDIVEAEISKLNNIPDEGNSKWANGVLGVLKAAGGITLSAFMGAYFNSWFGNKK